MQPNNSKNNQMYMPVNNANVNKSQLYQGIDANNLVNFYNSNLLDEMLQKNQSKFMNKSFGNAASGQMNPHLRKSTQSALANPISSKPAIPTQNSLLKQQMYSG